MIDVVIEYNLVFKLAYPFIYPCLELPQLKTGFNLHMKTHFEWNDCFQSDFIDAHKFLF